VSEILDDRHVDHEIAFDHWGNNYVADISKGMTDSTDLLAFAGHCNGLIMGITIVINTFNF
jgi:hypothetical protein